ncbi:MAG: DUF2079 domain-containing protein [Candidatus Micrarchaeia archaeon]
MAIDRKRIASSQSIPREDVGHSQSATTRSALKDPVFIACLAIGIVILSSWLYLSYMNYIEYVYLPADIGLSTYSFYFNTHFESLVYGLQLLVIVYNHIEPLELIFEPIFYVFPSPLTLIFLQDFSFFLAAIVVYFISLRINQSRFVAAALFFAFMINPGIRAAVLYPYHGEAYLPLLALLAFYFYTVRRPYLFALSYILLLTTVETAAVVGAIFLVFLLLLERKRRDKKFTVQIALLMLATALYYLFCSYVTAYLTAAYASGAYSNLPPFLRLINFYGFQLKGIASLPYRITQISAYNLAKGLAGIAFLLFGFGTYVYRKLTYALLIFSPWLYEVFILNNPFFASFTGPYYLYVIYGSVLLAILAIGKVEKSKEQRHVRHIITLSIAFSISTFLFVSSATLLPFIFSSSHISNPPVNLQRCFSNITNYSVMLEPELEPHLYEFRRMEIIPAYTIGGFNGTVTSRLVQGLYYFKPQFIITGNSSFEDMLFGPAGFNVSAYTGKNYSIYARFDNMTVYKLDSLNFSKPLGC